MGIEYCNIIDILCRLKCKIVLGKSVVTMRRMIQKSNEFSESRNSMQIASYGSFNM